MSSAARGNSACAVLPLTSGCSCLIAQFVPANGDVLSFWGGVGGGGSFSGATTDTFSFSDSR